MVVMAMGCAVSSLSCTTAWSTIVAYRMAKNPHGVRQLMTMIVTDSGDFVVNLYEFVAYFYTSLLGSF